MKRKHSEYTQIGAKRPSRPTAVLFDQPNMARSLTALPPLQHSQAWQVYQSSEWFTKLHSKSLRPLRFSQDVTVYVWCLQRKVLTCLLLLFSSWHPPLRGASSLREEQGELRPRESQVTRNPSHSAGVSDPPPPPPSAAMTSVVLEHTRQQWARWLTPL